MRIESHWQGRGIVPRALWPLSAVFCAAVALRRRYYALRNRLFRRLPVPVVIVVGNITVGGTGKTPMVVWLANQLKANGFQPGIVSRGYGGAAKQWPQAVTASSDPGQVGDEPVLIAARTGCPLYAAPNRVRAAKALMKAHACNVLIADDGLQHYRLQRDIEVIMVDGRRRFSNGYCLPAGPLREPVTRLQEADFVVVNGRARAGERAMGLRGNIAVNILDPRTAQPLEAFRHQTVNAVAGIGDPPRFFDMLRAHGVVVREHPFPDHHAFTREDVDFGDDLPVLMTEKDGVKCRHFDLPHLWTVPVSAVPDKQLASELLNAVRAMTLKNGKRR